MRRLWLLPAFALALYGADITGRWVGTVEVQDPGNGDKIATHIRAEFAQQAEVVTGKIGRAQDEKLEAIRDGKVTGKTFAFEVMPEEATAPMRFALTVVNEDRIEGDMAGAIDVGKITGKVVLTRVK